MIKLKRIIALVITMTLISCGGSDDGPVGPLIGGPTIVDDEDSYLKDLVNFHVGMAIVENELNAASNSTNLDLKHVLENDFNSLTFGNEMKMYNMFPAPGTYDWTDGDALIAYAKENGMRVHGHTLIWHPSYSIPDWLENFPGTDAEFEEHVKNYIIATVSHFAEAKDDDGNSIVESWDVVNEALTGDAISAVFQQRMGEDYVAKCFQWAREGDLNVKLFYNDYNVVSEPNKRANIINMVNDFKSNGIPIDGIGMQMHLAYDTPTESQLKEAIEDVKNTGLLVHISELDVRVNYNDDVTELTEARAQAQADQYQRVAYHYKNIVPILQQHGITIWGVRDRDSWLSDGGTEWPLIYDDNYEPKPAYEGFTKGLKGNPMN